MSKEVPYYSFDSKGNSKSISPNKEPYIDDDELLEMLLDVLPDNISPEEVEEILKAASDENLSEEEFDNLANDFISKNIK